MTTTAVPVNRTRGDVPNSRLFRIVRDPSETRFCAILRLISSILALTAGMSGLLVLVGGWILNYAPLQSVIPGAASMKFNTALCLMLAASAILLERGWFQPVRHRMAQLCSTLLIVVSALTLLEYVSGWGFGIDELFVADRTSPVLVTAPGRMAATTAIGLLLLGCALLMGNRGRGLFRKQVLTLVVAVLCLSNLVGYLYGIENFAGIGFYTAMAVHTSASLLILSLAALFSRPDRGLMSLVSNQNLAGVTVRRLLPAAVLVPILLGWLTRQAEVHGVHGAVFGLAIFSTANVVVFSYLIWTGGRQLNAMEAEKQEAEESFRLAVEASPSGMVMSDCDGRIVLVNSRAEELFGYGRRELLGNPVDTLVPKASRQMYVGLRGAFFPRPLARPMGVGHDMWARRKDGTQFPVEIGLNPIETERGTWVLSSITDITERKRSEATLRESEERFRNMADTAPVLIWVSGPDRLCTFFNKVWLEFTGRSMQQELGNGWLEGVHPDDRDRCTATYSAAFDAHRRFRMEYRLRRADGEYRWILDDGTPRFTSGGTFAGFIGSCVDITEKRCAEEERQKFVSLADRSLEFVGMCDVDFRPFFLNPAGLRLVGLDNLEAACQVKVQDYFFPEDQPFITNEFFPRVLREGHGQVEIRFRHFKTGEAIWMIYNVFSIFDARGVTVGWATVSINLTERKRAERALQQSQKELRALAGRLINAEEQERKRISRELHDDLSQKLALLAFDTGSLILSPPHTLEEMKEPLRNLRAQVVQLSQDVRKLSHQLHPSILEDLGLSAALRELCDEFSAREGLEVAFEQESMPILPVEVASCLYRVAQEALHNVSKHARATQVRLKMNGSPEGVQLCIRDTGVGFDLQDLSRPGLGIVSMKERVDLVHGEFSVQSQPGQGTTVRIFVPLTKETQ